MSSRKSRIQVLKTQDPSDVLKSHHLKKPATNASKSYLKSRRSQARGESMRSILDHVDDLIVQKPASAGRKPTGTTKSIKDNGVLNMFHKKKRRYDEKIQRKDHQKEERKGQRKEKQIAPPSPPRSPVQTPKFSNKSLNDDDLIVDAVLRRYQQDECFSFSDHQEMAEAELISNITNTSPTELRRLKVKLASKLKVKLGIPEDSSNEDSSLADSDKILVIDEDGESDVTSLTSFTSLTNSLTATLATPNKSSHTHRHPMDGASQHSMDFSVSEDGEILVTVTAKLLRDGKYSGTLCASSGKPHGSGRMEYRGEKGVYEGEWHQGRWRGTGKQIKPNGDTYEGQFHDNLYHGEGVFVYDENKRRFEGQYVMGERIRGVMKYADESVYRGQFYHGRRHGRGIYTFKDGSRYKGDFTRDLMHGIGELRFRDGSKYVGEWKRGKHHGKGNMYRADGCLRWAGMWKNGKQVRDR